MSSNAPLLGLFEQMFVWPRSISSCYKAWAGGVYVVCMRQTESILDLAVFGLRPSRSSVGRL